MSLNDFNLYSLKVLEQRKKRKDDQDLTIEMTRSFMALFANANRGKGNKAYEPTDFFKLSYDITIEELPKIEGKNFLDDMKVRFTPRNKRKNG